MVVITSTGISESYDKNKKLIDSSKKGKGKVKVNKSNLVESPAHRSYLNDIQDIPLLTAEEEYNAIKGAQNDDQESMDRIVLGNVRFALKYAISYYKIHQNKLEGMDLNDVVQLANDGLVDAVLKFDLSTGNRFTTYASWHIEKRIRRGIIDYGKTVRIPVHMAEKIKKCKQMYVAYEKTLGHAPSNEELSKELGYSEKKVTKIMEYDTTPQSLDSLVMGDTPLGDFVSDKSKDSVTPDNYSHNDELRTQIYEAMSDLTDREKEVMEKRFGLTGKPSQTLEEIGKDYNLTRERIRQIEAKALKTLRHPSRSKPLEDFYME